MQVQDARVLHAVEHALDDRPPPMQPLPFCAPPLDYADYQQVVLRILPLVGNGAHPNPSPPKEKEFASCALRLVSANISNGVSRALDSRFRGNDGGRKAGMMGEGGNDEGERRERTMGRKAGMTREKGGND